MKKLFLCAMVTLALMGCRDDAPQEADQSDVDGCTIYEGERVCLNPEHTGRG